MPFAGRYRKSPGFILRGSPSFISALAEPLTIINCSLAVCQCHGTTQPGLNFNSSTEGPLAGSPRCTAMLMHSGNPGMLTNVLVAAAACAICAASCARTETVTATADATSRVPSMRLRTKTLLVLRPECSKTELRTPLILPEPHFLWLQTKI